MKLTNTFALGAVALLIGACGKPATMGKQSSSRGDIESELHGAWSGICENKTTKRVSFDDKNNILLEENTFIDSDCLEKDRAVKYTATYKLHHHYKEGIGNSLILKVGDETKVTFHGDVVDDHNTKINEIANAKYNDTKGATPVERAKIKEDNEMLKAAKLVEGWKKGHEKTLNWKQLTVLNGRGLNVPALGKVGAIQPLGYQVDNGYLILQGGKFAGIYTTEKK